MTTNASINSFTLEPEFIDAIYIVYIKEEREREED
jgi:hypothetical protein